MPESRPLVLIIDDNPDDRAIYREYLTADYDVLEAELGEPGLALVRAQTPACVLLDYALPDLDGVAWLGRLQAAPVLILTGTGREAIAVAAFKQGAVDYLIQPDVTPAILQHAVHQAIEQAARQQTLLTQRQQVEESEAWYRTLLNALADGVFVAQDYRFVFANPALAALLGYELAAFVGLPFAAVVAPELLAQWTERFTQRVGDGPETLQHYDARLLCRDGSSSVLVELHASRIRYQGRPAVLGVVRDLTARRQMEEALRASKRRHRSTFENAAGGIVHFGLDGHFLQVNETLCALLGYTRDELLATDWSSLSHPDELPLTRALRGQHCRGETASYALEQRYTRQDGHPVWVHLTVGLLRDEHDTPLYYIAFVQDITARKQAEEALRDLNATLEQRVAERTAALGEAMTAQQRLEREAQRAEHFSLLGRLAAGVSHELRNPLGAVFLNVDLLAEELAQPTPDSPQVVAEALAEMKADLARVEDLVEDYLSLVRVGALERTVQDLGLAVQAWSAVFQRTAAARGVTFQCDGAAGLGPVAFHANTLHRALLNLVDNALDAMPRGGTLTLTGHGTPDAVHLEVRNTGLGIPAAKLAQIFAPLHTTKPGGTGLGLYIVQEIVTAHGGQVTVTSCEGAGSTFTLTLPRAVVPDYEGAD